MFSWICAPGPLSREGEGARGEVISRAARRRSLPTALAAASLALAALVAAPDPASAQAGFSGNDWRRESRPRDERYASPQHFAFELRFGPYSPEVDEEFAASPGPYEQVFGDGARLYFGVEVDWQPLRIPWVGAIGPGFGWGYTRMSAKARITGSDEEAGSDTSLTIMPMHLSAVLRIDELMRRTGIPVVPYAKLGVGLGYWSTSAAGETSVRDGVKGEDTSLGTHLALGGMLSLNWLERRAASSLDESAGINHAYLFGEWMKADLDGIGSRPQMHVGTSTWVVGFAFDF